VHRHIVAAHTKRSPQPCYELLAARLGVPQARDIYHMVRHHAFSLPLKAQDRLICAQLSQVLLHNVAIVTIQKTTRDAFAIQNQGNG